MNAEYSVRFYGDAPESIKVGDELVIVGRVTVKSIDADLIDVTSLGVDDSSYTLGRISIDLYANRLEVQA